MQQLLKNSARLESSDKIKQYSALRSYFFYESSFFCDQQRLAGSRLENFLELWRLKDYV